MIVIDRDGCDLYLMILGAGTDCSIGRLIDSGY